MSGAKVLAIVRLEYVESVRKKSFLFGLVATPLVLGAMLVLPFVSDGMLRDSPLTVAVLDRAGGWDARLLAGEDGSGPLRLVPAPAADPETLDRLVADGELSGWLHFPADFGESGRFEYRSESVTNLAVLRELDARVERLLVESRAERLGIPAPEVEAILAPAELRTVKIGRDGGREAEFDVVYLRAVGLVMILFFALIPTGHILLRSVIEEKSNRVIEVLLSSVTPLELMAGKILGLGAVGLTLLATWAAVGAALALRFGGALPVGTAELGIFVLYFLPGYFFFAALLGGIGSLCSSERDAQPFLTPISLTLMIPIVLGVAIAQSPDHWLARAMSFFPPLTPSLMLFRFAIKEPPAWEIAATWTVLLVATAATFAVAARVFRTGILMTGKRPSLPEVVRWVRAR